MLKTKPFMKQCNQILHFSELPLLVWTFTKVPTLFILFLAFLKMLFCFWFHNMHWPAALLFEPVHYFSGETNKKQSLDMNSSHRVSALDNIFSCFYRKRRNTIQIQILNGTRKKSRIWRHFRNPH